MKHIFLLCIFLQALSGSRSAAQSSKKETGRYYRQISKLTPDTVRNGMQLELAKEYSMKQFVTYYVEYGKTMDNKKHGPLTIEVLYTDSNYTYFGRHNSLSLIDFFKVANTGLSNLDYHALDGNKVRQRFLEEIVPEADKQRVKSKEKDCMSGSDYYDFNYSYDPASRELKLVYTWKLNCDFLYKIINKTYTAKYSIDSGKFIK